MRRQVSITKRRRPSLRFIRETISELKKVVWPTRPETTHLTTIVIIVAVAMGLILGIIDFIFTRLMNQMLAP